MYKLKLIHRLHKYRINVFCTHSQREQHMYTVNARQKLLARLERLVDTQQEAQLIAKEKLWGNATSRRGSSVEMPRSPSGRLDIFICKNFTIFLKISCDPTVIPEILQRRVHSVGTQLGVKGP